MKGSGRMKVGPVLVTTVLATSLGAWASARAFRAVAPDPRRASAERARTPKGMVYVAGGDFQHGSSDADADPEDRPLRSGFLASFYIDRTEVTNAEFRRYRPSHEYPRGEDRLPVTNVTYDEAAAYARWAGKRIPTALEWEKAARGCDGRRYPWGNMWEPDRVAPRSRTGGLIPERKPGNACSAFPSRVQPVGSRPAGAGPYGCLDMAGNAWEWVQGFHLGNREQRMLRGGAVGYGERACRTYGHAVEGWNTTCRDTGFRCARSP